MNQGRIWCVVSPNVGLPLLLGSVAVTSLIVHASLMTHTTWMSSYWAGSARPRVSANDTVSPAAMASAQAAPAFAITVAPVPGVPGKSDTAFVVTVTPNPAVADDPGAHVPGPLALAKPAE